MDDPIANLEVICVRSSGERFPVLIEIGRPYMVRDGKGSDCARCPVAMRGLHDKLSDIAGEDTFQALTLALKFTRLMLEQFREKGGRVLFSEDGETDFDFNVYFPNQKT